MFVRATILSLFILCVVAQGGDKELVYRGQLHEKIKEADRIVVRDGGDTCCVSAKETLKQPVYFEVTDREEIKQVFDHLKFEPQMAPNDCMCCGHPGIDWYKGKERVALTAWKHGYGIVSNGIVATLTPESRDWLKAWLLKHNLKEGQIE